jgi:hydroxymethylpyrimidine pyrophosphatase-like HAD family hydrolase
MEKQDVNVRTGERLVNHEQLPGPLRMSVIASPQAAGALVDKLRVQFDGRLNVCSLYVPAYDFTVVESLAASASKLNGVMYVAQAWRIGRGGIVAIGDDMNDLAMVQGAALGVAMSTAPQALRDAANYVIPDGLAGFLHQLAAGVFD